MPHGIYPDDLAAAYKAHSVGKKWQPSNGTEGEIFISSWCCECERDKDEDCRILADSFAYKPTDPEYPKEWCYGKDGQPCCTAFCELGKPLPEHRDVYTIDMFPQKDLET